MARDGFSGKIISAAVMARKNNLIIYENIYRAAVTEFGLWDQVRDDYGREFYLMLYVQESYVPPEVMLQFPCTFRPLQPVTISLKEFGLNLISA